VVPLSIRFGDEELLDRRDLTPAQFWARCAASPVLPETAAPAPGAFQAAFEDVAGGGADGVVCVTISSKLSATIAAASAAASALEGRLPVRVVDSRSVTMGLGMIVLAAARAAEGGGSVDEVAAAAEALVPRTRVYGTLDTLENLTKGGRIGAAQALLGSLLSVKPVIEVRDGEVAVISGEAPDVDTLCDLLGRHLPRERLVLADLGAVIGTHAGPRTIGVAYQVA
ncbi:MAG TPA: DegV family protein, partial [Acidimicrobiales bacterium]|nr:DegV family protein [Acidimicrobiales bacterium]